MEKPCCSVYIHTLPNNKVYVGWSRNNPEKRWLNGMGYSQTNFYFFKDILYYGWSNIRHEIVATNLTDKEATELEMQLIAQYNSNDPLYGYNRTKGGEGLSSEDCRHANSESRKANRGYRTYKKSKIILRYDLLGNYICSYRTQSEAARELGINVSSVHDACTGKQFQCKGNFFVFEGEQDRIPLLLKEAKKRINTNGFGRLTAVYYDIYGENVKELLNNL